MKKAIVFFITIVLIIAGLLYFVANNEAPAPAQPTPVTNSSSAISTTAAPEQSVPASSGVPSLMPSAPVSGGGITTAAKGGVLPTATTRTIACNLTATLVTNGDNSQQANVSWTQTAGALGFIPELNFYATTTTGTVESGVLTAAQTFTLIDADGVATSTCQTSATPTSFAAAS